MPKKKTKKMDRLEVAEKEDQGREIHYISTRYKVPAKVVRKAISELKFAGKGYRSRRSIYKLLRSWGYRIMYGGKPQGEKP